MNSKREKLSKNKLKNIREEKYEINIPTPYPQTNFMLISNPKLENSKYTKILNEKFPPRKFLKHNFTSWLKCNKGRNNNDINANFIECDPTFSQRKEESEYRYREEKDKYENIDNIHDIENIDDAKEIIKMLQKKLRDYNHTNNENIQKSVEFIEKLKNENEFYKNKLLEGIEKFEKLGIDFYEDSNADFFIVDSFRKKWLKRNFMINFKLRVDRIKLIKSNYKDFENRKNSILIYKSFLALEKYYMTRKYLQRLRLKNILSLVKKSLNGFQYNVVMKSQITKFEKIKRIFSLFIVLKKLKLNSHKKKYLYNLNKKALFKYYLSLCSKTFTGMKKSVKTKTDVIDYRKIFEFRDLDESKKINKIKALNLIKNCLKKNFVNRSKNAPKYFDHKLSKFFSKWKIYVFSKSKMIDFKINKRKNIIQEFFSNLQKIQNNSTNQAVIKMKHFYYKKFLNSFDAKLRCKAIKLKNKQMIKIKKIFISRLIDIISEDPKIRFKRIQRKFRIYSVISELRCMLSDKNNKKSKNHKEILKIRCEMMDNVVKLSRNMSSNDNIKSALNLNVSKIKYEKIFLSKILKIIHTRNRLKFLHTFLLNKNILHKHFTKLKYKSLSNKVSKSVKKNKLLESERLSSVEAVSSLEEKRAQLQSAILNLQEENKTLLIKLSLTENTISEFNQLYKQNISDLKYLQESLDSNDQLLKESSVREERLQQKYCHDIQNTIKMNKKLNIIIVKKNTEIAELKLRLKTIDSDYIDHNQKLCKENATLLDTFTGVNGMKDQLEKEKYKNSLLLSENKQLFEEIIKNKI